MLWEGEDPEIPLGPARERGAKASAGRWEHRHHAIQESIQD